MSQMSAARKCTRATKLLLSWKQAVKTSKCNRNWEKYQCELSVINKWSNIVHDLENTFCKYFLYRKKSVYTTMILWLKDKKFQATLFGYFYR